MKRVFAFVLAIMLCAGSIAEGIISFKQSPEEITKAFDAHMYALWRLSNVQSYPVEWTEEDNNESHVIKIVNDACALHIDQVNGKATQIQITTRLNDNTDYNMIIAAYCALLAATNFEYMGGEATYTDTLNLIMADNMPHTIGDVTYRFGDSRPFANVISLTATPAE